MGLLIRTNTGSYICSTKLTTYLFVTCTLLVESSFICSLIDILIFCCDIFNCDTTYRIHGIVQPSKFNLLSPNFMMVREQFLYLFFFVFLMGNCKIILQKRKYCGLPPWKTKNGLSTPPAPYKQKIKNKIEFHLPPSTMPILPSNKYFLIPISVFHLLLLCCLVLKNSRSLSLCAHPREMKINPSQKIDPQKQRSAPKR